MRPARLLSPEFPPGHDVDGEGEGPLSLAFYTPSWPADASCNGVVMYVEAMANVLRGMGHRAAIVAGQVSPGYDDTSVYDVRRFEPTPGLSERVVSGLARRVAPERLHTFHRTRALVRAARQAVAREGVQLLDMEETFGWALAARRRLDVPVLVRLHGPWFLNGPARGAAEDSAFRRRVRREGLAIAAADAVTAPSLDVLEKTRSYYGLALPHAEVVPNPLTPVPPSERWRADRAEPGLLLFVGRFDRHKGGDVVLDAFAKVSERHPGARLLFVGPDRGCVDDDGRSWSFEEYLRARHPGLAETGRVEYLGRRLAAELPELRRRAAVTVVASRYETFGLTLTEALYAGCPTAATRIGAFTEFAQDGATALLARPGDPVDMAEKIGALLDDPALAEGLGRRAAEGCDARLGPEGMAGRLVSVYRRAIARRRQAGGRP